MFIIDKIKMIVSVCSLFFCCCLLPFLNRKKERLSDIRSIKREKIFHSRKEEKELFLNKKKYTRKIELTDTCEDLE